MDINKYIKENIVFQNDFDSCMMSLRKILNYLSKTVDSLSEEDAKSIIKNKIVKNIFNKLLMPNSKKEKHEFSNFCYSSNYIEDLLVAFCEANNLDINDYLEDEIKQTNLLTREETNYYIDKWQKEHDYKAREILIVNNEGLVNKIVLKYSAKSQDKEDLFQEGVIGLMRAIDKYDYTLGYRFSTYAWNWIKQYIRRSIMNKHKTIRIPVHQIEKINLLIKVKNELFVKLNHEPTMQEIAEASGIDVETAKYLLSVSMDPISLDEKVGEDSDATIGDFISTDEVIENNTLNEITKKELNIVVHEFLSPKEAEVISLRFGLRGTRPHTLQEIGEKYGITRERARQIEAKSFKKLRSAAALNRLSENGKSSLEYNIMPSIFIPFKKYNPSDVLHTITLLPEEYQRIIYKRYGKGLNEYNEITDLETDYLYLRIFKEMETLLSQGNVVIPKPFMQNFDNMTYEEVLGIIINLPTEEQSILIKAFGNRLNETKEIQNYVIKQLNKTIKNIKTIHTTEKIKKHINSFYDLLKCYDHILVNEAATYLTKQEQKLIYKVFGEALDEFNLISEDEFLFIIHNTIPKMITIINSISDNNTPKPVHELFNLSYYQAKELIACLDKEEKVDLYKYYGYCFETPKPIKLSKDFKNYVTRNVIAKLYELLYLNNILDKEKSYTLK